MQVHKGYSVAGLIFVCVLSLSCLTFLSAKPAGAQAIAKPYVPHFALRYVNNSYDVPPVYGTDPYTGKTVLTQEGYHIQNASVEVTIRNQAFNPIVNEGGSPTYLCYMIATKGYYENWLTYSREGQPVNITSYTYFPSGYWMSTQDSEFTVITFGLGGNNGTDSYSVKLGNVTDGGTVDFRVQAIIGYSTRYDDQIIPGVPGYEPGFTPHHYVFIGQESDWSNTQTITLGETIDTSPIPTYPPLQTVTAQQTPAPSVPEFSTVTVPILLLAAASTIGVLLNRKRL
jgi:hypothetical protein